MHDTVPCHLAPTPMTPPPPGEPAGLPPACAAVSETAAACTRCGICGKECAFLQRYGLPGDLAAARMAGATAVWSTAFSCSLCGLCAAVCPIGLDPARMFLDLRREAWKRGEGDFPEHLPILLYEKRGVSRRYTWYALPEGCDTVFFPGCALAGTRPATTLKLFNTLRHLMPSVGIVLDCCTKPSHDLGRQEYFETLFFALRQYLLGRGVRTVLVACPSCHKVFAQYGAGLQVNSVLSVLAASGFVPQKRAHATVTVHDPCPLRAEAGMHEAARTLIRACGLTIKEMEHAKARTFCCGEGGAVGYRDPDLAHHWGKRRKDEAHGRRILAYCAGCATELGREADHLLDLLFETKRTLKFTIRVRHAPFTALNRLRLKRRLRRDRVGAITGERLNVPAGNASVTLSRLLAWVRQRLAQRRHPAANTRDTQGNGPRV